MREAALAECVDVKEFVELVDADTVIADARRDLGTIAASRRDATAHAGSRLPQIVESCLFRT